MKGVNDVGEATFKAHHSTGALADQSVHMRSKLVRIDGHVVLFESCAEA